MAQMDTADSGNKKGGKKRGKKMSTRVDLTPMVDLAFLLITFFMMTTTMNKPQVMEINMPVKPKITDPKPPEIAESKVLTLLLGSNDIIWYYEGITEPKIKNATFKEIRKIILDKKAVVEAQWGKDKTVIIIKPTKEAKYKNVVDIFDEMSIDGIASYAMVDVTAPEVALIDQVKNEGKNGE